MTNASGEFGAVIINPLTSSTVAGDFIIPVITTQHNDLQGKQGGSVPLNEFFHLTQTQLNDLPYKSSTNIWSGSNTFSNITLTGIPIAPTADSDTSTTQIATCEFVLNQQYAKLYSPTFTGEPDFIGCDNVFLPASVSIGDINDTEIYCLSGVTSNIQTQINTHAATIASSTVLGHIKVGSNLEILGDGTLNAMVSGGGGSVTFSSITGDALSNTSLLGYLNLKANSSNNYTYFTGATSSTKTYTLPNASCTILTNNSLVTVLQGGTGVNTSTGSGSVVLNTSPTLVTPILGTPQSGNLANCTFPTLNQDTTGSAVYWKTSGTGKANITGPATGTTRTYTFPDANATVLYSGGALGTPSSGTLTNCTFPTLNQNTTGSAASLSISGQTGLLTFTGLASTNRIKTVRDAADTILELGGSYTPTGTWTSIKLNENVALTTTSTKLNYLTSATGTTGTNTTNVVFSASPTLTGTLLVQGTTKSRIIQVTNSSDVVIWTLQLDGTSLDVYNSSTVKRFTLDVNGNLYAEGDVIAYASL